MKWFRNALTTLLRGAVQAELTAQRARESAHIAELTGSIESILDQLNRALARQAMRRAREVKAQEVEEETDRGAEGQPEPSLANYKAHLRQRAGPLFRRKSQ